MKPQKETREERFRRLAEARVNKLLQLFRLLGNLSWTGTYAYTREQVEQIFTTLQMELVQVKMRFLQAQKQGKKPSVRHTRQAIRSKKITLLL